MDSKLIVALMGNPNSGKTTIFNELTGSRQHVGNYPGVTVERKEGYRKHKGEELKVVDLPGTYSLTAYSAEELIARNFLLDEKPDVVVDIIDASNLERNLYLATQLRELGVPLILVFNMSDMAKHRGFNFNLDKLKEIFGVGLVATVGTKGQGMDDLLDLILKTAKENKIQFKAQAKNQPEVFIRFSDPIEEEIKKISSILDSYETVKSRYSTRWLAIKLLEQDKDLLSKYANSTILKQLQASSETMEKIKGQSLESVIASERYDWIAHVCEQTVRCSIKKGKTISEKIDAVVTNRMLGIPIFLGMMYLVFHLTFTLGGPVMDVVEALFGRVSEALYSLWPTGSESLLLSLLADGIIGGVGGVLVFLPNILLLFLAISFLEDSGYMARAAFIMDRLMHKLGLHGKSFIPMLIGFGCSIPAIMATRTLENRRDRLTTMLVIPLISCGAKLPIYLLIIPAFFPQILHAPMLWVIYLIGIILAIISAKILRSTVLKGDAVPFVMELPPYRLPTLKGIVIHMWERGWLYLKKAGTIILAISILLWAMSTFPVLPESRLADFEKTRLALEAETHDAAELEEFIIEIDHQEAEAALRFSIAGRIGRLMEPLISPLGFDWRIGTALIGAFAAKEVFVAQLGIVFSIGEADEESDSLRDKLQSMYPPLVGFCIMLFCLISAPCMATVAIMKRESNSWRWALFQLIGLTIMAYVVTLLVFQIGKLLGIGIG